MALALQTGLLDVQVVAEAAGHLGGDAALGAQAFQLRALDPEQLGDQLGVAAVARRRPASRWESRWARRDR